MPHARPNGRRRRLTTSEYTLGGFLGCLVPLFTLAISCAGDDPTTELGGAVHTGVRNDTAATSVCVEDPDRTLEGTAVPLVDFEFRDAFDPADVTVYDPPTPPRCPVR